MPKAGRERGGVKPEALAAADKWAKARMFGQEFDAKTFSDALEVVYWIRQVIAVVVGIIWGLVPLTGAFGLIGYGGITALGVYAYTHKVVVLDEEDFPPVAVLKEGFMPAFGMFLMCWVLVYTQVHGIAMVAAAEAVAE